MTWDTEKGFCYSHGLVVKYEKDLKRELFRWVTFFVRVNNIFVQFMVSSIVRLMSTHIATNTITNWKNWIMLHIRGRSDKYLALKKNENFGKVAIYFST